MPWPDGTRPAPTGWGRNNSRITSSPRGISTACRISTEPDLIATDSATRWPGTGGAAASGAPVGTTGVGAGAAGPAPIFWPFLWGDIFSFAFWPYDYYDPFWAYGPDFLLASIFTAGPYFGTSYGYSPDYYGYSGLSDVYYGSYNANSLDPPQRHELEQTQAAAVQSCNGLAPGVDGLPITQIRETVHPTGEQAPTSTISTRPRPKRAR